MSKFSEFYAKVLEDEASKKRMGEILQGKSLEEANDEELLKIGELAQQLGFAITMDEAKSYLNGEETELDEDDLDAVAGGKGLYVSYENCQTGYQTGDIKIAPFV